MLLFHVFVTDAGWLYSVLSKIGLPHLAAASHNYLLPPTVSCSFLHPLSLHCSCFGESTLYPIPFALGRLYSGFAELLKCPLYHVSADELGTNPRELERELTMILDLAYNWGAILLLDKAVVFLEARMAQDIHRNALVSIFLRLLEVLPGYLDPSHTIFSRADRKSFSRMHS